MVRLFASITDQQAHQTKEGIINMADMAKLSILEQGISAN